MTAMRPREERAMLLAPLNVVMPVRSLDMSSGMSMRRRGVPCWRSVITIVPAISNETATPCVLSVQIYLISVECTMMV